MEDFIKQYGTKTAILIIESTLNAARTNSLTKQLEDQFYAVLTDLENALETYCKTIS